MTSTPIKSADGPTHDTLGGKVLPTATVSRPAAEIQRPSSNFTPPGSPRAADQRHWGSPYMPMAKGE